MLYAFIYKRGKYWTMQYLESTQEHILPYESWHDEYEVKSCIRREVSDHIEATYLPEKDIL